MSESKSLVTCPRCGSTATALRPVETGMKLALQQVEGTDSLPTEVCEGCIGEMTSKVSQGVRLRLEKQAKEKNKHMLWKSRVGLVKNARQLMQQKAFSEAAVSYEKYIRVLEVSYDLKPGELSPSVFGKTSRSKELSVIASTYWDLMRIYDTRPAYRDRMSLSARKLAEFCPYSPLYPDIVKKAQSFMNSSKNPDIVRQFLKETKAEVGKCFVATTCCGSEHAPLVIELRKYRDFSLKKYFLGRSFISFYYLVGPYLSLLIDRFPFLKPPLRSLLSYFVYFYFRRPF